MITHKDNSTAVTQEIDRRDGARAGVLALICSCFISFLLAPCIAYSQKGEPAVVASEKESYQSIFINDPSIGKDPFFPNSTRRAGMVPIKPRPSPISNAIDHLDPGFDHFSLKGISLSANKKLALINSYTFAEGEEQEVRVADQTVRVRCVTILERSAVIRIKGREKELTLREGL